VTSLLAFGSASAQQARSADAANSEVRKAADAGNAKYSADFANLDTTALAARYDMDGVRMAGKGKYARGRAAIGKSVSSFMKAVSGPIKVTIETEDKWVVGDPAYETRNYTYTFTPTGERESQIGGHYVTICKREKDGDRKIIADLGVPND
jgi:ketosteroid isomerase-like protein